MKVHKFIKLGLLSFVFFCLAAIYITYPLIFHLGDRVTGFGDELVIAWIQNWVIHAIATHPFSVFEANLYYPYHNSLAFSDTFFVSSFFSMLPRLIIGEPISVINWTLITSLIFLGFSVYLLCFYLTRNSGLSLFAGMLVIFSPAVLDYSVHLQVLSIWCVPIAILFFLHFIKTSKSRFLAISLLFFVLQVFNSILPGYFILFAYVILFFWNMSAHKKNTLKLFSRNTGLLFLLAFSFLIPIVVAYYSVSYEFQYVRDLRDAVHFAFQPEDFLYPGNRTKLQNVLLAAIPTNQYSQNGEFKPGYLGVVFSLLVIFASIYVLKGFKKHSIAIKSFFSISLLGFIVSLGPVLHLGRQTIHEPFLIPLPYALFYYILPGFQGLRNSGRWNMLFILAIVVVIALVLNNVLAKYSMKKQLVIYGILFLGVLAELNPLTLFPITQKKDFPKEYSWIATTPSDTKIIELPIYNWNMNPYTQHEIWREYYGTVHFRRTVNGYTGFSPPPWQKMVTNIDLNFPSDITIRELKQLGIDYVIIHTDEYDSLSNSKLFPKGKILTGPQLITNIEASRLLKRVATFHKTYVYKL